MWLSKRAMILAAISALAASGLAAAVLIRDDHQHTTTFDPPYPRADADGQPLWAVFEGRIPCHVAGCDKRKVGLALYGDQATRTPRTYWLGIVAVAVSDEREIIEGAWRIGRGVNDFPSAVVYELDAKAPDDLRQLWRVSDDILLPLDDTMRPKAGNAAWGYMLSRHAAPYGPRTYQN